MSRFGPLFGECGEGELVALTRYVKAEAGMSAVVRLLTTVVLVARGDIVYDHG